MNDGVHLMTRHIVPDVVLGLLVCLRVCSLVQYFLAGINPGLAITKAPLYSRVWETKLPIVVGCEAVSWEPRSKLPSAWESCPSPHIRFSKGTKQKYYFLKTVKCILRI